MERAAVVIEALFVGIIVPTTALSTLRPQDQPEDDSSVVISQVKWAAIGAGTMLALMIVITLLVILTVCVGRRAHSRSESLPGGASGRPAARESSQHTNMDCHVYDSFTLETNNQGRALPPEPNAGSGRRC